MLQIPVQCTSSNIIYCSLTILQPMMISRVSRLIFYLEIRLGSSAQAKVEFSSKIVVYIFILFLAGVFILVIYLCHKKKKEKPLFMCLKLYNTTCRHFWATKVGIVVLYHIGKLPKLYSCRNSWNSKNRSTLHLWIL